MTHCLMFYKTFRRLFFWCRIRYAKGQELLLDKSWVPIIYIILFCRFVFLLHEELQWWCCLQNNVISNITLIAAGYILRSAFTRSFFKQGSSVDRISFSKDNFCRVVMANDKYHSFLFIKIFFVMHIFF